MRGKYRTLVMVVIVLAAAAYFWPRETAVEAEQQEKKVSNERRSLHGTPGEAPATEEEETRSPPLAQAFTREDGDFDVVVTAAGKPVANATVLLYYNAGTHSRTFSPLWQQAGTARTNAEGRAQLFAKAGLYLLTVRARDHAVARKLVARPQGEPTTRVEVTLAGPASLVIKSDPVVPLAEVTLETTRHGPPEERLIVRTDTNGQATVPLAPGTYEVYAVADAYAPLFTRATAPGELLLKFETASYLEGHVVRADGTAAAQALVVAMSTGVKQAATTNAEGAFSLAVGAGRYVVNASLGSDVGSLSPPVSVGTGATRAGLVIRLEKPARIEGLIYEEGTHKPLAGAEVAASPHGTLGELGVTVSGADGRFVLQPLAPGHADLVVKLQGYGDGDVRGVRLRQGETFKLDIALEAAGSVEGVVTDQAGQAVANAIVQARRDLQQTRTDVGGHYLLRGLSPGRMAISAKREGELFDEPKLTEVKSGETTRVDFTLLAEEGTLELHVTKPDGSPVSEVVEVSILWRSPERVRRLGGLGGGTPMLKSDAQGVVTTSLPPGSYSLVVGKDRVPSNSTVADIKADERTKVTIALTEVNADQFLRGRVIDAQGQPVPFANVAYQSARSQTRFTQNDGSFSFMRDAAGTLRASYHGQTSDDVAVDEKSQDVVVKLRAASRIVGHVVASPPPTWIEVSMQSSNYRMLETDTMFMGTDFVLDDAPPGQLTVNVKANDGRTGQAATSVPLADEVAVTVHLAQGATVIGRLLTPAGQPAERLVRVAERGAVMSGHDGRFILKGLAAGEQVIRIGSLSRPVTLRAGETVDLGDIALER